MTPTSFQHAQRLHQAGQLADVQAIYRRILRENPDHAEALHMLGVSEFQLGRHVEALELIRRAIALEPARFDFQGNLGLFLLNLGQTDAAIEALKKALAVKPDFPQARHNLGDALRKAGKLEEAIEEYRIALTLRPDAAQTHNNLGDALLTTGQIDEAIACFRQALLLLPDSPEILFNLGTALARTASLDEAIAILRRALELRPNEVDIQNNLANALAAAGRASEAVPLLRRAVATRPTDPNLTLNLANALKALGRMDESIELIEQALSLRPQWPEALSDLAATLVDCGQIDSAIALFRRAIQIAPNLTAIDSNLVYYSQFSAHSDPRTLLDESRRWSRQHADPLRGKIKAHGNVRDPDRRLRIGYVSPDFRDHCQCLFTLLLFRNHDHERFEIYMYAGVARADDVTQQIRRNSDVWRDILGQTDDHVAQQIRDDRIDILIDLTMHMHGHRLLTFAQKPAPIQITWLAYPGTTGLKTIDYRLTDPYLDPPGEHDDWYAEKSIRLPHTFWCYDPGIDQPEVNDLPALKAGHITFGCLNNLRKVTDPTLSLWSKILTNVPDSKMIMLAPQGKHRQLLLEKLGIDSHRVEFVELQPRRQYLETYHRIDLCLDTFPYNGHTTSLDSFWMGVPVATILGHAAISRAGFSQASNLGLASQLVAADEERFVALATDLASDLPRLAELRATLRQRMQDSPLMDTGRFARDVEAAYRKIWRDWCASS